MTEVPVADIRSNIARHFGVSEEELITPNRKSVHCDRRAIGYQLSREMSHASLTRIGSAFGDRDHTTVLAGLRRTLPLEMLVAKEQIRYAVELSLPHSKAIVRAYPFRSRRGGSNA